MKLPQNSEELLSNLEYLINQTYEVEKEFKELKNILNGVIEFLPQAIWVVDKDNNIIAQNSKAKKLPQILETNQEELEIQNKVYLIQKSFLEEKTIISATDITEQKRNQRLISMGQMAAHLSHEIRNPIGSISILLSVLAKKCSATDIILDIKKALFRVERIIKSTLLFSKGLSVRPMEFCVSKLEKEIKNSLKYYSWSKNINFIYSFENEKMKADFDLFLLVLQNIIFNAIDAIEENDEDDGVVEILYKKEDAHYFYIFDNGVGFEDTSMIFEPFKTTKTKGNGLGLALAMQIIDAHNGEIFLTSHKKGFGIKIPSQIE